MQILLLVISLKGNIFNILFVVGLSALIVDIPFAKAFHFDSYVAIASAVSPGCS